MKPMLIRFPEDVAAGLERYVEHGQRSAFVVAAVRGALLLMEEEEAQRNAVEFQRQVEAQRPIAESIVAGLKAANVGLDQWLVENRNVDGPLLKALLMVAEAKGDADE